MLASTCPAESEHNGGSTLNYGNQAAMDSITMAAQIMALACAALIGFNLNDMFGVWLEQKLTQALGPGAGGYARYCVVMTVSVWSFHMTSAALSVALASLAGMLGVSMVRLGAVGL